MSNGNEDKITQTQLLRAFEATVGRADRERQEVSRENAIVSGQRDLWMIDSMDVAMGEVRAEVAEGSDELLLPRKDIPLTLKFSLRRVSGQTQVKEEGGSGG